MCEAMQTCSRKEKKCESHPKEGKKTIPQENGLPLQPSLEQQKI